MEMGLEEEERQSSGLGPFYVVHQKGDTAVLTQQKGHTSFTHCASFDGLPIGVVRQSLSLTMVLSSTQLTSYTGVSQQRLDNSIKVCSGPELNEKLMMENINAR